MKSVFVSAVSTELANHREVVKNALLEVGFHPVVQEHLSPTYEEVESMLSREIAKCDAVICLVGFAFGRSLPGCPERSFAQLEYDIAIQKNKRILRFLLMKAPGVEPPETMVQAQQQLKHRHKIQNGKHVWFEYSSIEDLKSLVHRSVQVLEPRGSWSILKSSTITAILILAVMVGSPFVIYHKWGIAGLLSFVLLAFVIIFEAFRRLTTIPKNLYVLHHNIFDQLKLNGDGSDSDGDLRNILTSAPEDIGKLAEAIVANDFVLSRKVTVVSVRQMFESVTESLRGPTKLERE